MMKRMMIMAIMGLVAAGTAMGTVYDYQIGGGGDASLWGMEGHNWVDWTIPSQGENWMRFDYAPWFSDGVGGVSRRAFTWAAPVNEYITSVTFDFVYNANTWSFLPAIYSMGCDEVLDTDTAKVWGGWGSGWIAGASTSLTFSVDDQVQKLGFGFDCPVYGYQGFFTEYSNVVITTIPEPVTISLLSVGGLAMLARKRLCRM